MTSASLFGKLQEQKLELARLEKHESQEKKFIVIALKADSKENKKGDALEEDKDLWSL